MATDAPYTGARPRAPENADDATRTVPSQNITRDAQEISADAEAIDALILGVETMLTDQRRIMRHQNAGDFLCDNELWSGVAVLLTMARHKAIESGKRAQSVEVAAMRANKVAAA